MKIYRDAIEVQDACNLSGVLLSWARAVPVIWEEINATGGGGTDTFNRHPVNVMFSDKVRSLTGSDDGLAFATAYNACKAKADQPVMKHNKALETKARKETAKFARELRTVRTPNLTMKERNQAIRSHLRRFLTDRLTRQKST